MAWFTRHTGDADAEWARQSAAVSAARADRQQALTGREELVGEVEALLFRHDPIGLDFVDNTDEYSPEAQSIVIRMAEASSAAELQVIVHEEFVRWFDDQLAGPPERYAAIAEEIWALPSRTPSV